MTTFNGKFDQVKSYLSPRSQEESDTAFKKHLRDRYSIETLPDAGKYLMDMFRRPATHRK